MKHVLAILLLFSVSTTWARVVERPVAEDIAKCEKEASKRVFAVEAQGESKFSKVDFNTTQALVEESEMPDMSGGGRRRRGAPVKIPPPQIGRKISLAGIAIEKAGSRKVNARCMVYKGKIFTATFELDALNVGDSAAPAQVPSAAETVVVKPDVQLVPGVPASNVDSAPPSSTPINQ